MKITSAKYLTSAVNKNGIIKDNVPEFAFVGRSNVGKSSLINAIVGQKKLAKTSSTAGLTKMVNYFDINNKFRFVDLPGYGYAKVGKSQKSVWSSLMGEYLQESTSLACVFVLLDVRIIPSELDKDMIKYLFFYNLPFRLIATKCDKLSKNQLNQAVDKISKELSVRKEFIMPTSSLDKQGVEKLVDFIESSIEAKK